MPAAIVKLAPKSPEAQPVQKPVAAGATVPTPMATPAQGRWRPRLGRDWLARVSLPLLTFVILLAAWAIVQAHVAPELPSPAAAAERAIEIFADPFRDAGPNDKGIGWQLLYSLGRVAAGFGLAVLVAIPVGFLMGASKTFEAAWQPLIQILRPVSPLAWLPIGLLLFKAVNPSAIFVIFITCIWPTLLNTAAGARAIPQDYMNVARVLKLNPIEVATKILLPAARPYILAGMRLSLGIAWMVIVAAEMLTGGIGIGFYVWDEWNNLNVASIIVAIVVIGLVGIALEAFMNVLQRRLDHTTTR